MVTGQARCLLVTWPSLAVSVGILAVYALGLVIEDWRTVAAVGVFVPAVTALSILVYIKESPIWLLAQGREEEARKSLEWIRHAECKTVPRQVHIEFETILENSKKFARSVKAVSAGGSSEAVPLCQHTGTAYGAREVAVTEGRGNGVWSNVFWTLKRSDVWKPLLILNCYFLFTQFSGIPVIIAYAVNIMISEGVALEPYLATVVLGLTKLVFEIAAGFVQNRQVCCKFNN
jgi:hypothetical protein